MIKEIIIFIYLQTVRLLSFFFRWFPISQNKIVILATFTENTLYILEEMNRQNTSASVILVCTRKIEKAFDKSTVSKKIIVQNLDQTHPKIIYHLMTSSKIIVDNYIGFLSAVTFQAGTECIQIWHANGAIKKFGLADHSAKLRNSLSQKRFRKVYANFHKIVVGSDAMADIFHKAFGVDKERVLKTGMPRTDLFFDYDKKNEIYRTLNQRIKIDHRKIILYAPTFRDQELDHFNLHLDLEKMFKHLSNEYILLIKLHPAILQHLNLETKYPGFAFDVSGHKKMNDLLLITDLLITDYSSIPFEYSLLEKPMLFFAYDLDQYTKERGLWGEYSDLVPGPILKTTREIIEIIETKAYDFGKIKEFSMKWNQYNNGKASENFVRYITGNEKMSLKIKKTL